MTCRTLPTNILVISGAEYCSSSDQSSTLRQGRSRNIRNMVIKFNDLCPTIMNQYVDKKNVPLAVSKLFFLSLSRCAPAMHFSQIFHSIFHT